MLSNEYLEEKNKCHLSQQLIGDPKSFDKKVEDRDEKDGLDRMQGVAKPLEDTFVGLEPGVRLVDQSYGGSFFGGIIVICPDSNGISI